MEAPIRFKPIALSSLFLMLLGWVGLFYIINYTFPYVWPRWAFFFLVLMAVTGTAPAGGSCTITVGVTSFSGGNIPTGQSTARFVLKFVATNTAPTIDQLTGPTLVSEHATTEHTYEFSFTDPDNDTWSFASGFPDCGTGGALVTSSATINQVAKTGEFKCVFDDGPASPLVRVQISDSSALSNVETLQVNVNNVAPTVSSFTPATSNILTGATVNFNATATDPSAAADSILLLRIDLLGSVPADAATAAAQAAQALRNGRNAAEQLAVVRRSLGPPAVASDSLSHWRGIP